MASAPPPASDAASASSSPLFTTFRVSKTSKGIENFLLSSTTPSVDLRYQIETPPPAYSVSSRASVSTLIYRGSGDERRRVAAVSWQYPEVLWRFGQGEDHTREDKFQLSDILPQEKWPSKSRVVKLSDDRSWIWSFSTTHLKVS
ncbi:hypothetical protein DL93DRAFT_2078892 [Clavulina sp. PMI_390]|nr:hypothetical protein DL93DRAFT_2078892 [Clavulina sp. PMI_390]